MARSRLSPRERLVKHVQELERLQAQKDEASAELSAAFAAAKADGNRGEIMRQVGNAVEVHNATALCEVMVADVCPRRGLRRR